MTPEDRKRTRKTNDYRCTADNPASGDVSGWAHPDATTVYEGALFDEIECPHCGMTWKAAKR